MDTPEPPPGPWVTLFLAAGQARRFGADKLLAPLPGGETVALVAARHLLQGLGPRPRPIAVLRPEQTELGHRLAALGFGLLCSPSARLGLGHSIAEGVAATARAAGWLLVLADMPGIEARTVASLAQQMDSGASAVAPEHRGQRGHPVGFGARWGAALQALEGDQGARAVLAAAGTELVRVVTDDPGVLQDIDTPTDLAGWPLRTTGELPPP